MPTINRDKLKASVCKDSYAEFVQRMWDTVIPDKLVWSWYLQYQCDEIQKIVLRACRGEDKEYDLLVNVPTGSAKSSLYSVFLTPWVWTNFPRFWCLGGSYSDGLAMDHGRMSRDVCKSDLYQRYYPHIQIREDADTKGAYINTLGGARYSVGRGSSVQGKHFHVLVVDDPLNPKEAVSDAALAEADYWIRHTLSGRKRGNKMAVPTILVMQRLAEADPSGVFLGRKKVKHICLPATTEYPIKPPELASFYTNGLLDPVRFPREFLEEERSPAVLAEDGFAGQYGQSPVPTGGGTFKVDRLKTGPTPHSFKKVVRSWDKASTPGSQSKLVGPAFSVGTLLGLDQDNRVWILDVKRQRIDTYSREQLIRQTAREDQSHYGYGVVVVIEQEAGSGGTDSAMGTLRRLHGFSVRLSPASGSKEVRAEEFSVRVNAGLVYLPQHLKVGVEWVGWAKDWVEELKHFPYSRYKDQVDSAAHGYKVLAGRKIRVGGLKPKAARQAARAQAWGARLQIARGP